MGGPRAPHPRWTRGAGTLGGERPRLDAKIEAGTHDTLSGSINVRGAKGPFYGSVTISDYATGGYNISRFGFEPDGSRAFAFSAKAGIDFNEYLNIEGVFRRTDRFTRTDPQDFNFPPSPTLSSAHARRAQDNFLDDRRIQTHRAQGDPP